MLEPLQVPAQTQPHVNLYVPSGNAIYEIVDVQGYADDPEVTLKRCAYDGTLVEPTIVKLFSELQANNYLVIRSSN